MTLTEFLLARIAEDEAAATGASHHSHLVHDYERDNYGFLWVKTTRVRAECEAKRRIVSLHRPVADEVDVLFCDTCHDRESPYGVKWPCKTMVALALPYADHPDYDPGWRP